MTSSADHVPRRRMQPRDEPRIFPRRGEMTEDELEKHYGPINKAWLLDDSRLRPDWELSDNDIQAALNRPYRYSPLQSGITKPLVERGPASASASPSLRIPSPTSTPSASVVDTEIRLICFDHVPSTSNHLILRLNHTSPSTLPSVQTYDAVSYVWGPPDTSHTILVLSSTDDEDKTTQLSHLRVSKHMYSMLKKLQTCLPPSVRFWVDALCINQQDAEERARQVRQMAKIYRMASRVHVFPGTATLEAEDVVRSAWFGRRWIVQEFVVAREVVVHSEVTKGNEEEDGVSKSEVDRTEAGSVELWDKTALEATYQPWSLVIDCLRSSINQDTMPTIQIETPDTSTAFNVISELEHLQASQRGGTQRGGILSLLCHFPHADCEDDRDRLYAFFGIANDINTDGSTQHHTDTPTTDNTGNKITPRSPFSRSLSAIKLATAISAARIRCAIDYTIPTSQVYLRFAKAVLRSAYPLDILHCAGAFRHPKTQTIQSTPPESPSLSSLPSWVPDWRVRHPIYTPHLKSSSFISREGAGSVPYSYTAGVSKTLDGPTRPVVRLSDDETSVVVKGSLVGTVVEVLPLGSRIPTKSSSSVLDEEGEDENVKMFFRAWYGHPQPRQAIVSGWNDIDNGSSGSSGGGVEGLCVDGVPFDTALGDVVVIFAGSTTPFVLRPCDKEGYVIVGECYIRGMMYGEAMSSGDMVEFVIV